MCRMTRWALLSEACLEPRAAPLEPQPDAGARLVVTLPGAAATSHSPSSPGVGPGG
jgi:hypothetical protein